MADFDNVRLDYGNFSFGPDAGRIYSIDHTTDSMIVKTFPGGSLVSTIPLSHNIQNEVLTLEYDGYYFWTQSNLGTLGDLGTQINKWLLQGSSLQKQLGVGSEIPLRNLPGYHYESRAMAVQRFKRTLTATSVSGSNTITVNSPTFFQNGNSIYIGPGLNNPDVIERTITNVAGSVITFSPPLNGEYVTTDPVTLRKNIWVFNNKNYTSTVGGSLVQVNSYTGNVENISSSAEWKHVDAATCQTNGDLHYIRGSQLISYRPFGTNFGNQFSYRLENIEIDNNTLIPVLDMEIDSVNIHKTQKKQHQFNGISFEFEDVDSLTGKFEVDTEPFAAKVTSITSQRNKSVFFGISTTGDFIAKVRDQYNIPIFGRSVSVQENDTSGFITPGFTSFVTNTQGEGTTRYDSGTVPDFNQPKISIIDVATDLRLRMGLEIIPRAEGEGFVQQVGVTNNITFVEQTDLNSSFPIQQDQLIISLTLLEQQAARNSLTYLEQSTFYSIGFVTQDPQVLDLTFVQQDPRLEDITVVEQFDFLIFAIPAPNSVKNPIDTNILVRIVGFGVVPLNPSTLTFIVNGQDVSSQIVIDPFVGGFELFLDPQVDFDYGSEVTVNIIIQDTDTVPRTISTTYSFFIVPDTKKPIISPVYPPDGSVNNLSDTEIFAIVKDLETGVDLNSIEMYVEGQEVVPTISEPEPGCIKILYNPCRSFFFESELYVSVLVADLVGNKVSKTWSFKVESSSGVLFTKTDPEICDVLVPIDTNVCIEVFGLEEGINIDSLDFSIEDKETTYVIVPKVYRKE